MSSSRLRLFEADSSATERTTRSGTASAPLTKAKLASHDEHARSIAKSTSFGTMQLFKRPRLAKPRSAATPDDGSSDEAKTAPTPLASTAPAYNLTSDAFEKEQAKRQAAAAVRKAEAARKKEAIEAIIRETDAKIEQGKKWREAAAKAAQDCPPPPPQPKVKLVTRTTKDGLTIRAPSKKFREFDKRTGRGRIDGPWKVSKGTPGVLTKAQYTELGKVYRERKRSAKRRWPWSSEEQDRRGPRTIPAACGPQAWFKK